MTHDGLKPDNIGLSFVDGSPVFKLIDLDKSCVRDDEEYKQAQDHSKWEMDPTQKDKCTHQYTPFDTNTNTFL